MNIESKSCTFCLVLFLLRVVCQSGNKTQKFYPQMQYIPSLMYAGYVSSFKSSYRSILLCWLYNYSCVTLSLFHTIATSVYCSYSNITRLEVVIHAGITRWLSSAVLHSSLVLHDWCFRGSKNLWNFSRLLPAYTVQHPRRQSYGIQFPYAFFALLCSKCSYPKQNWSKLHILHECYR